MTAYSPNTQYELKPWPVAANLTRIKIRNSCLLFCTEWKVKKAHVTVPLKSVKKTFWIFFCKTIFLANKNIIATTHGMTFYIFVRLGDAGWSILHAAYHLQSYHYWSPLCILGVRIFLLIYKCYTTGKPTRSFATERVSLDSV